MHAPLHTLHWLLLQLCSHICQVMLTYCLSATFIACSLDKFVSADACDPTYLALAPCTASSTLLMRLCSHICDPTHSLLVLSIYFWGQMLVPSHTLHRITLLKRLCSHSGYARISPTYHTPCTDSYVVCGGGCLRMHSHACSDLLAVHRYLQARHSALRALTVGNYYCLKAPHSLDALLSPDYYFHQDTGLLTDC